jgi:Mor family transcriptional regulator
MNLKPETHTLNGYAIQAEDLPEDLREIAEEIGLEALLRLVVLRGGEPLYLPKKERLAIAARDRAIVDEFNGRNFCELARKHGLTERWVRVIVAKQASSSCQKVDKPSQVQLSII